MGARILEELKLMLGPTSASAGVIVTEAGCTALWGDLVDFVSFSSFLDFFDFFFFDFSFFFLLFFLRFFNASSSLESEELLEDEELEDESEEEELSRCFFFLFLFFNFFSFFSLIFFLSLWLLDFDLILSDFKCEILERSSLSILWAILRTRKNTNRKHTLLIKRDQFDTWVNLKQFG